MLLMLCIICNYCAVYFFSVYYISGSTVGDLMNRICRMHKFSWVLFFFNCFCWIQELVFVYDCRPSVWWGPLVSLFVASCLISITKPWNVYICIISVFLFSISSKKKIYMMSGLCIVELYLDSYWETVSFHYLRYSCLIIWA